MNEMVEWSEIQSFLVYMGNWKHRHEKGSNLCLMDSSWLIQAIGACPLMWWYLPSVHVFLQRQKVFCSLSVNLEMHMFGSWDQVGIVPQLQICPFLKGCCNRSNPKSYNKWSVLIAFLGFGVFVSNDPDLGTALNSACCFCQLSIHVGSHFIHRSWFFWGLIIGCPALPLPL